jgi:hypothetical protein
MRKQEGNMSGIRGLEEGRGLSISEGTGHEATER